MKRLTRMLIACSMFGSGAIIQAQNAIPASGSNASGSGGTVSYSLGQVVYTIHAEENGSVAQGVQQPFEISMVSSMEEATGISLDIAIFPNPAKDFIRLKIESEGFQDLRYQLYDLTGNLLLLEEVEGNFVIISMQNYLPATYFLKVTQGWEEVKTRYVTLFL